MSNTVKILKTWDVHGEKVPVPDPSQFKIEGTKLADVRNRLAARGLKSPWLRNAAWRYHPGWYSPHIWQGFFRLMLRGVPYAAGIVAAQVAIYELWKRTKGGEEKHLHGFTKYVPKTA